MIDLEAGAAMAAYQRYIEDLEAMHGWTDVDLVHNCFLLGEEVGELFKAVRRHKKLFEQGEAEAQSQDAAKAAVAEELVDVFNYLLALANRLDIDLESAFRAKNARNQSRTWT
ncbi:MAG: MazG nucleotide pyrophosphohydrolase domain-containing protein [Myxococcota bacterium]